MNLILIVTPEGACNLYRNEELLNYLKENSIEIIVSIHYTLKPDEGILTKRPDNSRLKFIL